MEHVLGLEDLKDRSWHRMPSPDRAVFGLGSVQTTADIFAPSHPSARVTILCRYSSDKRILGGGTGGLDRVSCKKEVRFLWNCCSSGFTVHTN